MLNFLFVSIDLCTLNHPKSIDMDGVVILLYEPSVISGLSTWQSENGSFPLCVKMAASCWRIENKSVAVYSAGGGKESVCDLCGRQTDVRVIRLVAVWKHVMCSRHIALIGGSVVLDHFFFLNSNTRLVLPTQFLCVHNSSKK